MAGVQFACTARRTASCSNRDGTSSSYESRVRRIFNSENSRRGHKFLLKVYEGHSKTLTGRVHPPMLFQAGQVLGCVLVVLRLELGRNKLKLDDSTLLFSQRTRHMRVPHCCCFHLTARGCSVCSPTSWLLGVQPAISVHGLQHHHHIYAS